MELSGRVENSQDFMAKASVLVLHPPWASFGIALIEAMACGTRVLATGYPWGVVEIPADGLCGRLVPVGDNAAMAQAIVDTFDDPMPQGVLRARAMDFSVERV